jgi:hypothetical protein
MQVAVKLSQAQRCANGPARHFVSLSLPVKIIVKFATIVAELAWGRLGSGISIATEL